MKHRIALLGAITTMLAGPAAAFAAGGVGVRVEGQSKTLVAATTVHLHAGWITKGGLKKGGCSAKSAAGALDVATHHRWNGVHFKSFPGLLVDTILGVKYGATAKYYWGFFVNGVSASQGACAVRPHAGDQILFAAVPTTDSGDYTLVVTGAPKQATAGQAFTVKVDYVNAKGKRVALGGATLSGRDFAPAVTAADGTATITPTAAGKLVLGATHGSITQGKHTFGYVRAPQVAVSVGA